MMKVKQERTGWRDEALSNRHREWGWDCPMLDIDFIGLEYDSGKPTAIVEYKNENAQPQYPSHPSYRALAKLGTLAGLPVFACRYASDFSKWQVTPLNSVATLKTGRAEMTEVEWVEFLYGLRGRHVPAQVVSKLTQS